MRGKHAKGWKSASKMAQKMYVTPKVVASENDCIFQEVMTRLRCFRLDGSNRGRILGSK
jgi:hypothetical protein